MTATLSGSNGLYVFKGKSEDSFFYRSGIRFVTIFRTAMRHAPTVLELTGDALTEIVKLMGGE